MIFLAGDDVSPKWFPDGSKILFCIGRDGNYKLYTMNADGSNKIRLTNDSSNDYSPLWSSVEE